MMNAGAFGAVVVVVSKDLARADMLRPGYPALAYVHRLTRSWSDAIDLRSCQRPAPRISWLWSQAGRN